MASFHPVKARVLFFAACSVFLNMLNISLTSRAVIPNQKGNPSVCSPKRSVSNKEAFQKSLYANCLWHLLPHHQSGNGFDLRRLQSRIDRQA